VLAACGGGEPGQPKTTESGPTDTATSPTTVTTTTTTTTTTTPTTEPIGFLDGSLCYARTVFEVNCVTGCHSATVAGGGLDLQTDPYAATVGKLSSVPGVQLVVPGQPENSLLWRKMTGELAPEEGDIMPPSGLLPEVVIAPVELWISQGAPNDCDLDVVEPPVTTATTGNPYHPPGWAASDQHGLAANLQTDGDCRTCHGVDLTGGVSAVTCDDCHAPGWRTDCTFCHGGVEDLTGAPPEDIDNNVLVAVTPFPEHYAHVDGDDHATYDCVQCHSKPIDVLTPGHVFEDFTPGYGEMNYTAGIAPISTYLGGTCSNVYCHGTGLVDGYASSGDGPKACYSCHPDITSDPNDWNNMSGRHKQHLDSDVLCSECHSTVVDANQAVIGPTYHVDGTATVDVVGLVYNGTTCDGACHGHNHNDDEWP